MVLINPLSAYTTYWPNTLKQFVGCCRSVLDHSVELALKGLSLELLGTSYFRALFNQIF